MIHCGRLCRKSFARVVLTALCLLFIGGVVHADSIALYEIEVSVNLRNMTVRITPADDGSIELLRPLSSDAWDRLDRKALAGLVDVDGGLALLPGLQHYQYSTRISGGLKAMLLDALFSGASPLLTDLRTWLWVPTQWQTHDIIEVKFTLPNGITVSAPWQMATDRYVDEQNTIFFLARPYLINNEGTVAIGRLQHETISVENAKLQVSITAAPTGVNKRYLEWIRKVADTIVQEFGRIPVPSIQFLVIPTWFGDEVVPTAEIRRGGGSGVVLIPNSGVSTSELVSDWTLYHEFAHLFHPYLGGDGRWVAEGIAGYYQYILLAKAGALTSEEAWRRLAAGFARGQRETGSGKTVGTGKLSMRTYWAGAVMALDIDVQLRRHFDTTLSKVLADFSECYLPSTHSWAPREFMHKLDEISNSDLFTDSFAAYSEDLLFPNYPAVLNEVGLYFDSGELRFKRSLLREAIIPTRGSTMNLVIHHPTGRHFPTKRTLYGTSMLSASR